MPNLPTRPLGRLRLPALTTLVLLLVMSVLVMIAVRQLPAAGQAAEPDVSDTQRWTTAQPDLRFVDKADTTCDGDQSDRYVRPGGVDRPWPQAGSSAQPWATIKFAMQELRPGQTGCVQPGPAPYSETNLKPARSGTADAPIALVADGAVTIQAPNDDYMFTFDTNPPTPIIHYWLLQGFSIDKRQHDRPAVNLFGGQGGQVGHIAVRGNDIYNSKAGAAVLVRGRVTDVLIKDNDIYGHQRWVVHGNPRGPVAYTHRAGYGRYDANAVSIEGVTFPDGQPSVQRIRVDFNRMRDNGGDGVQCQGGEANTPPATQPLPSDPVDIDLVDNRVVNTLDRNDPNRDAIEENAFDIKSCRRVTIRGSDPPDQPGPAAAYNKAGEFLPTRAELDWKPDSSQPIGSNTDPGTAVVVHFNARQVRIENLRIWDACQGIRVGRDDSQVEEVVIRRVLVFRLRYQQGPTPSDAQRCQGRAIELTNTSHVDIYHNTIVNAPDRAIRVARQGRSELRSDDIDLWNNVLSLNRAPQDPAYWIDLGQGVTGFESDYNLFWHQKDQDPDGVHFLLRGARMSLATWRQRTPWDRDRPPPAGSTWGDPQWILNPYANDFFTMRTSPARDGAKNNTGAQFCDTDLQPDPDQGAPDIGFRETCDPPPTR